MLETRVIGQTKADEMEKMSVMNWGRLKATERRLHAPQTIATACNVVVSAHTNEYESR